MKEISAVLGNLTLDDLREWAGAKILSRGKSYVRNVKGLCRMADGALAAWVSGNEKYAVSVRVKPDAGFEYSCTCPYDWGACKHAVAVVLAAAEHVKQKKDIPLLDEEDDLFQTLFGNSDDGYEDDGCEEDDEWDEEDEELGVIGTAATGKAKTEARKIFEGMGKDELVTLLLDLTARYPEIERGLRENAHVQVAQVFGGTDHGCLRPRAGGLGGVVSEKIVEAARALVAWWSRYRSATIKSVTTARRLLRSGVLRIGPRLPRRAHNRG